MSNPNTIKILQVVGSMNRGGAETFLMNVLRNIDKEKFEFFFLCYGEDKFDYEDEIYDLGSRIIRVPDVKRVGVRKHIRQLKEIITENNINVVQAHTYYNSVFALAAAKFSKVNHRIVHSHNTQSEPNPSLLKKCYFLASKIGIELLAVSYVACGEDAGRALYMPWRKFQLLSNAINIQDFAYDDKNRHKIRKELGINRQSTVVMHAGRFTTVKNHNFLIDIFAEYHRSNPDSRLILVGDGPLKKSIEAKVKQLGLTDAVIFLGLRTDVNRIYSAADIFVFPSLFEGLPVVLVEAQANGIQCLISDSVDKNVKLTDSLKFLSLLKDANEWSHHITDSELVHNDSSKSLCGGAYDMSANIKYIEGIYKGKQ